MTRATTADDDMFVHHACAEGNVKNGDGHVDCEEALAPCLALLECHVNTT